MRWSKFTLIFLDGVVQPPTRSLGEVFERFFLRAFADKRKGWYLQQRICWFCWFVDLFNDQYCRCVYLIVCFWWFLAKKALSQNLIAIILRAPNLGDGFTPKYWQLFQSQLQLQPNGRVHGGLDLLRISKKRWASVAVGFAGFAVSYSANG